MILERKPSEKWLSTMWAIRHVAGSSYLSSKSGQKDDVLPACAAPLQQMVLPCKVLHFVVCVHHFVLLLHCFVCMLCFNWWMPDGWIVSNDSKPAATAHLNIDGFERKRAGQHDFEFPQMRNRVALNTKTQPCQFFTKSCTATRRAFTSNPSHTL